MQKGTLAQDQRHALDTGKISIATKPKGSYEISNYYNNFALNILDY